MEVVSTKHKKLLTKEEWEWIVSSPSGIEYLNNALEVVVQKDQRTSPSTEKTIEHLLKTKDFRLNLESLCETTFYVDAIEQRANVILRIYFYDRNDLLKCKMTIPSMIGNNASS